MREGVRQRTTNRARRVRTSIILCCDIVSQVVIQNETQQAIEESQVDLLVDLGQYSFHEDIAFTITGFPDIS